MKIPPPDLGRLHAQLLGRHVRTHSGLLGAVLRSPSFKSEEAAIAKRAQELLDYVGIGYHLRDFDDICAARGF